MLPIALMLAAAQVYVDPYEGEQAPPVEEAAPAEEAPAPDTSPLEIGPGWGYSRVGFTGNVGAVVPLPQYGELGITGGLGVRYGLLPPPSQGTYFTPALSILLAGEYVTATSQAYPATQPLGSQLTVPSRPTFGDVGVDVRLELTVSRQGGMLMPQFATWLSTGTAVGFDGQRVFPTAHVGFGLGIDFVRDVAPALGKAMFNGESWGNALSGGWGSLGNLGGLGGGGAYGIALVVIAIVLVPILIIAGMCAFFLASSAASMANVEMRYTVLPGERGGVAGFGSLVIGFGI